MREQSVRLGSQRSESAGQAGRAWSTHAVGRPGYRNVPPIQGRALPTASWHHVLLPSALDTSTQLQTGMLQSLELWLVGSARGLQEQPGPQNWLRVNKARPA